MLSLQRIIAAHPLCAEQPYNRIKLSRVNGNGTALYRVGKGKREYGAAQALRTAFQRFGGRCFHCEKALGSDGAEFTLDHLRPKRDGGDDHLHNLVFACLSCNRSKGGDSLVEFQAQVASAYLKALDAHLVRCLKKLGGK